jgi:hypothetical protein
MGQRSDEIAREIDRTRGELANNLQELESRVKDATDWRQQFRKNPLAIMGIAFGGGLLLSRLIGGGSHRREMAGR